MGHIAENLPKAFTFLEFWLSQDGPTHGDVIALGLLSQLGQISIALKSLTKTSSK